MNRTDRPLPRGLLKTELNDELNRLIPSLNIDWCFLRVWQMRRLIREIDDNEAMI
jgi:hypothetical protein